MPVHKVVSNATRVQIWTDSSGPRSDQDIVQILIDQGGAGNEDKVAAVIKDLMQADLEVEQPLSGLPSDDPDKTTDPARPDLFHRTGGGPPRLVGRSVIVESVVWDAVSGRYIPALRRAN